MALAKAAKVFNIPTTITSVETDGLSGNTYPELLAVFPQDKILECTPKAICGCWSMKMIWLFCGSGLRGTWTLVVLSVAGFEVSGGAMFRPPRRASAGTTRVRRASGLDEF